MNDISGNFGCCVCHGGDRRAIRDRLGEPPQLFMSIAPADLNRRPVQIARRRIHSSRTQGRSRARQAARRSGKPSNSCTVPDATGEGHDISPHQATYCLSIAERTGMYGSELL